MKIKFYAKNNNCVTNDENHVSDRRQAYGRDRTGQSKTRQGSTGQARIGQDFLMFLCMI